MTVHEAFLEQDLLDLQNKIEEKDKRIAELEKENAELKGEADSVLDNWCKGDDPCPHLKKRDEQLTKAKEIIKDFLLVSKVEHLKDRYETVDEAEKFLNEVEKCGQ